MADFKIGDKVKLIKMPDEYNERIGKIIKDGGTRSIPVGFRKLGEGIKGRKEGQHLWVIMLDDTNETIVLPEVNIEKI